MPATDIRWILDDATLAAQCAHWRACSFVTLDTEFMRETTYWPKLCLLETMGIIRDEEHELNYLKQVLPRWDTTFPDTYRVDLQMNRSVKKVLRPAAGWHPPTLSFTFVDSAQLLEELQTP